MRNPDRRNFLKTVPLLLGSLAGIARARPTGSIRRLGRDHVVINGWVLKWSDLLSKAWRWR